MKGNEVFKKAVVLTEENFEQLLPDEVHGSKFNKAKYFEEIKACVRVLKKKYAGIVNGLWISNILADDGGIIGFVRTTKDVGSGKFELHGDIGDFLHHEYLWRFTDANTELIDDMPVEEWAENGNILTILDTERGV